MYRRKFIKWTGLVSLVSASNTASSSNDQENEDDIKVIGRSKEAVAISWESIQNSNNTTRENEYAVYVDGEKEKVVDKKRVRLANLDSKDEYRIRVEPIKTESEGDIKSAQVTLGSTKRPESQIAEDPSKEADREKVIKKMAKNSFCISERE